MIIASEINFYKKEEDIREVMVEIEQPKFVDNVWECTLLMNGYGKINQTLIGQTSMQALSFAMQHAKLNLTLLVNDGYNYFDKENNRELNQAKTLELLNDTYGHGTLLDEAHTKAIHLQTIRRLQKAHDTEEEQDADINYLRKEFADPKIIDYIFYSKPALSAIEIYEKAKAYKPINL
jgi:hypothetical protein